MNLPLQINEIVCLGWLIPYLAFCCWTCPCAVLHSGITRSDVSSRMLCG